MFPKKPTKKQHVYLDHGATTQPDALVTQAMEPWLREQFANPSALYSVGVEARSAIEDSRTQIADILHATKDTIVFTSGGTESTNMAILGVARKYAEKGKHIITTEIEHPSVLEPMKQLEKEGFEITYLPVNEEGLLNMKDVVSALREDTILVSIMYVNNEIGSINPIHEIGKEILKWRKKHKTIFPLFHTDACQAASTLDVHVERLHVDLMSINGSKLYGPKGIGLLYKRRGVELEPLMYGGGQEQGIRSGTENVASIMGMAEAFRIAHEQKESYVVHMKDVRDYFFQQMSHIPGVHLNGPSLDNIHRSVGHLNMYFEGIDADALVLYLDEYGIMCAKGSACATGKNEASHVLEAIGLSNERIGGSIRFTIGRDTTKKDIDYVMEYLPGIVEGLRTTV